MDDFTKYKRLLECLRDHKGGRVSLLWPCCQSSCHVGIVPYSIIEQIRQCLYLLYHQFVFVIFESESRSSSNVHAPYVHYYYVVACGFQHGNNFGNSDILMALFVLSFLGANLCRNQKRRRSAHPFALQ